MQGASFGFGANFGIQACCLLNSTLHFQALTCSQASCTANHIRHFSRLKSGCLQANFLWAYATLGERVTGSCSAALASNALALLPRFNPQELSNTAWALASMDILEPVSSLHQPVLPKLWSMYFEEGA